MGLRPVLLVIHGNKYRCNACRRHFRQQFPGIARWKRTTAAYRRQIFVQHHEGISQRTLAVREHLGGATVERWFQEFLDLKVREGQNEPLPRVLGIDEHYFSRKEGFATTFCDLAKREIHDVTLGRSEKDLEPYLNRQAGKDQVRVVCMDLSPTYRSIVRKHLVNALIVSDRFHVIRLMNQRFLETWKLIDPKGHAHRGLLRLMRGLPKNLKPDQWENLKAYLKSHPAMDAVYGFWQKLGRLLRFKHRTAKQCRRLIPLFIRSLRELRSSGFASARLVGENVESLKEGICRMVRVTKNNGIPGGFQNQMEMISPRALGFRNFENYRLRGPVHCG